MSNKTIMNGEIIFDLNNYPRDRMNLPSVVYK